MVAPLTSPVIKAPVYSQGTQSARQGSEAIPVLVPRLRASIKMCRSCVLSAAAFGRVLRRIPLSRPSHAFGFHQNLEAQLRHDWQAIDRDDRRDIVTPPAIELIHPLKT